MFQLKELRRARKDEDEKNLAELAQILLNSKVSKEEPNFSQLALSSHKFDSGESRNSGETPTSLEDISTNSRRLLEFLRQDRGPENSLAACNKCLPIDLRKFAGNWTQVHGEFNITRS